MTVQDPTLQELTLPHLAESVVEGELLSWLIGEGEPVRQDQPVAEVMTDKVTVELPSPLSGILRRHLVQVGEVVAVGAPLALVEVGTGNETAIPAPPQPQPEPEAEGGLREERSIIESGPVKVADSKEASEVFVGWQRKEKAVPPAPSPSSKRVLAVPSARQLAREQGVDLAQISGSGPNGTVRREDVQAQVQAAPGPAMPAAWPPAPPAYRTPTGYEDQEERTPFRGTRRAISQALHASLLYTAQTHTIEELDCTALMALRAELRPEAEAAGVKLSYLPFFCKAVAVALREFPALNSSLDEARGELVRKHFVHLGLAVNTDAGLVVPVLRDVDRRSVLELARESADLAERARAGTLKPGEMQDATFTVSNIGAVGALVGFPIVNPPATGILSLHSIVKRPVALERDGEDVVAVRPMMYLTLGFDHRLMEYCRCRQTCPRILNHCWAATIGLLSYDSTIISSSLLSWGVCDDLQ